MTALRAIIRWLLHGREDECHGQVWAWKMLWEREKALRAKQQHES